MKNKKLLSTVITSAAAALMLAACATTPGTSGDSSAPAEVSRSEATAEVTRSEVMAVFAAEAEDAGIDNYEFVSCMADRMFALVGTGSWQDVLDASDEDAFTDDEAVSMFLDCDYTLSDAELAEIAGTEETQQTSSYSSSSYNSIDADAEFLLEAWELTGYCYSDCTRTFSPYEWMANSGLNGSGNFSIDYDEFIDDVLYWVDLPTYEIDDICDTFWSLDDSSLRQYAIDSGLDPQAMLLSHYVVCDS